MHEYCSYIWLWWWWPQLLFVVKGIIVLYRPRLQLRNLMNVSMSNLVTWWWYCYYKCVDHSRKYPGIHWAGWTCLEGRSQWKCLSILFALVFCLMPWRVTYHHQDSQNSRSGALKGSEMSCLISNPRLHLISLMQVSSGSTYLFCLVPLHSCL